MENTIKACIDKKTTEPEAFPTTIPCLNAEYKKESCFALISTTDAEKERDFRA